mgnify:FL=1
MERCRYAAENYVPNGLFDNIPAEWECDWEQLIKRK